MVEAADFAASGHLPQPRILFAAAMAALFLFWAPFKTRAATSSCGTLRIVAAENFYQNIAAQLAGPGIEVRSILSEPGIDPHEYEPSVRDAEEVATADLVIENGGGYDEWMKKLLSASPKSGRLVINGWDISPVKLSDNEHVWYSVEDMKALAAAVTEALRKLCPSRAARFESNLRTFTASLDGIAAKIDRISKRFSGTPIALTEPIFMYQALPMGLKVLTPFEFQKAVAQGIDPPADTMLIAGEQVKDKKVRLLVINRQTADRFTARLEELAKASSVPVVEVSETMPPGKTYQSWMLGQMAAISGALGDEP